MKFIIPSIANVSFCSVFRSVPPSLPSPSYRVRRTSDGLRELASTIHTPVHSNLQTLHDGPPSTSVGTVRGRMTKIMSKYIDEHISLERVSSRGFGHSSSTFRLLSFIAKAPFWPCTLLHHACNITHSKVNNCITR